MKFVKWSSIENTYRTKEINYYRELHEGLDNYRYVITEKIHGSNISVHFEAGQEWRVGKRNSFLSPGDNFYDIWNVLERYREGLEIVQAIADRGDGTIRLYGELYGAGVQKGVDYGSEKRVAFFGMKEHDALVEFITFQRFLPVELPAVPIIRVVDSLQEALDYNTEFVSRVGSTLCEGVVIQPLDFVLCDNHGSPFLLKKKNEKFLEMKSEKKPRMVDAAVDSLQQEIGRYVTDARLQNIFSKEGEIERPNQIGDYIKLMVADVTGDFAKDYQEFADMDKGQRGQVLKVVGKLTANLLKGYL